jgi:hypothetical protein
VRAFAKAASAESTETRGGSGLIRRVSGLPLLSGDAGRSGARAGLRLGVLLACAICAAAITAAPAAAAPPTVTMGTVSAVSYASAHVTGEVDPTGESSEYFFEVSTDGANWQRTNLSGTLEGSGAQPVAGEIEGLHGGTTYFVRLTAYNFSESQEVHSAEPSPEFTTLPVDPPAVVSIADASNPSYTTAEAAGKMERPANVDPAFDAACHFEYVTEAQFTENQANSAPAFEGAGAVPCELATPGEDPVKTPGESEVTADLTGLAVGTAYHLRLAVSDAGGADSKEAAATFSTLTPAAATVSLDPVTAFTATTAHFSGHITPGGTDPVFAVNWEFKCMPECPGLTGEINPADTGSHEVTADATGLEPNTEYHVELIATNAGGPKSSTPVSFKTTAVGPTATTLPAFVLGGGTSALLGGPVDPKNSATVYWVEYGTDSSYGSSTPHLDAGQGGQAQVLTQEVSGLAPGTVYHYRLVAENASDEVDGEDMTLKTPVPASSGGTCPNADQRVGPSAALPECRAYELVTPPDLGGPSVFAATDSAASQSWSPVAADGDAVIWQTEAVLPGSDSSGVVDFYLSRRDSTGWTSTFASPPGSKMAAKSGIPIPLFASPDLDRIIWLVFNAKLDPSDPDPVDSATSEVRYKDLYREEPDGSFTWLTRGSDEQPAGGGFITFGGASTDALKVVFGFDRQLEPGAPGGSVYQRAGQTTTLVSRDENGSPLVPQAMTPLATSADGSVAVFLNNSATLYLSRDDFSHSVKVVEDSSGRVGFESLSADGSRLFFISSNPLVAGDEDTSRDLYEYDADTESLTRLSAPTTAPTGPGPGNRDDCIPLPSEGSERCDVAGVAISRDGSKAYFVSPERLDGSKGTDGEPNLYLSEAGETQFVATLDPADRDFGEVAGNGIGVNVRHVRFTPDGSKLIFESRARLTAYDNAGHVEIYEHNPATGELICASCRPDGTPSAGDASLRDPGSVLAETSFVHDPLYVANSDKEGNRIFFQSRDAILPGDKNGEKIDVYEFDVATGTTSLISSGKGPADTAYMGNGIDGRDVFIVTADPLVPRDGNAGAYKIYDARIGGGFAEPTNPVCEGEGCRGPTSSEPPEAAPATSSFVGSGDPLPHRRKHRRHRKHHHHRSRGEHHSKRHKRETNHAGRAGR